MGPVRVLAFGNRISGPSWAREIAKTGLAAQADNTGALAAGRVEIDLSYARSADFLVLGRLIMLIRGLTAGGTEVVLRGPTQDLLAAEQDYLGDNDELADGGKETAERQISQHQRQRINCRLFIEQSGFEAALRTGPFQEHPVEFGRGGSGGAQPENDNEAALAVDQLDKPRTPLRRRGIIPYRWLDLSNSSATPADVTDQLLRSIAGLGLTPDDAEAVAQGILAELIENVREHAYPDSPVSAWVLIGGELTQHQSYATRLRDFDLDLQNLVSWAAKEPSPLLRLFVGDSGVGISGNILDAFNRHASETADNREADGLWKATRIVKSFHGSLLVTSGSATAGHIHEPFRDNPNVEISLPAWLPGTTVESTIPTASDRAAPARSPGPGTARLACVTVTLYSKLGLDFSDKSAIQHQLDQLPSRGHGGLAVLFELLAGAGPAAESDIESAISSVLEIVSESESPRAVALVFPGVSTRLLKLAIESINGRQASGPASGQPAPYRPALVVSAENAHYWVGGTRVIRDLLRVLSQSAAIRLRLQDVAGSLHAGRDVALGLQIRGQPQLLHFDGEVVSLKLRPRDALDALTDEFRGKVSDAMLAAKVPGVEKGYYLTTSLRETTRWINSRDLLRHLRLDQVAGLLLANAVANGSRPVARSANPSVICVGSVDERTAFILSLALNGTSFTLDSFPAQSSAGKPVTANPERPVILCTDVISRGALVRKTVRDLWDKGFTQVSVATLIDGRDLTYADGSRDFLSVRGRDVPLASLAFVSLDPDRDGLAVTGQEPQPIDPVTGMPLPSEYPKAEPVGEQSLYLEAIMNSGAARLGHIHRTGQRHFSAYISPSTLFDYEPWKQNVFKLIISYVKQDNDGIGSPGETHTTVVIYPSEVKDDFARVVHSLTDAIDKAGIKCLAPVVVPRSLTDGEWAFPRTVQLPEGATHIVAIDSTSKTGRTLRELIRLAAAPGIKFISCFGLILGMNDLAAMSLEQVRQVATYSMENLPTAERQVVPIGVRYLVRTAVSGEDAEKCPICRLQRAYASLPAALPRSMADYRLRLVELLGLRSKDSVFGELATDLFGVHLSQRDCIGFLDWRSKLEEARFSTEERNEVFKGIRRLAQGLTNREASERTYRRRDALIRLIAAEHSRLDEAPMWFTSVRASLAQIVRSLLKAPSSRASDPMLRVQALVVLARADRHLFCAEYADIVRMCRDHETVLTHALLEALVLLTKSTGHADWGSTLTEQISELLDEVENEPPGPSVWAYRPAEELTYLAAFGDRGRPQPPLSRQQAWAELRKFCDSVKRHKYDQALWRLERRLERSSADIPASSRANVVKDWQLCSAAIEESILPNLAVLREILGSGKVIERRLPSGNARQLWRNVVDGGGPEELNQTTVAVGRVFLGSEPATVTQEERNALQGVVERWGDFFFRSPPSSANPAGTSILTEMADQCPTDLIGALHEVFGGSTWDLSLEGIREGETVLVFCASATLLDAITHVQINAEATHREEGQNPRFQIGVSACGPDEVIIELLNSGSSRVGGGGGHGLRNIAESLALFGGRLEPIADLPPGVTYGVRLILERWRWS